jgi:hypothetical protein
MSALSDFGIKVKNLYIKHKINPKVVTFSTWKYAISVELEHKKLTHGNLSKTSQIVLDHLSEDPHYYRRLKRMESSAAKYWRIHKKPLIFKK